MQLSKAKLQDKHHIKDETKSRQSLAMKNTSKKNPAFFFKNTNFITECPIFL